MVNERNRDAGISPNVQYADIDYIDAQKDFTIDSVNYHGLKKFFSQSNADGLRTIIILDPGDFDDQQYYTPTVEGIKEDVFIKWDNGRLIKGACWPSEPSIPGFFKTQTHTWWSQLISGFHHANLAFDGLWIDMNEPALFGTNEGALWN